jgi:hypothetical protein
LKLRLGGAEFPDIREYAAAPEQQWNVSDSQLWRYIQAADALCKEYFNAKADHLLNRHLLQRRQLFAHALAAGDFATALRVLQDEGKLEQLYPQTAGQHQGARLNVAAGVVSIYIPHNEREAMPGQPPAEPPRPLAAPEAKEPAKAAITVILPEPPDDE